MSQQPPVEEKIEEAEDDIKLPPFFLNALKNVDFAPIPQPHASAWEIVEVDAEMDDGTKKTICFLVETRFQGNQIAIYWYDHDLIQSYVNTALLGLQRLRMAIQAANPLVVANQQDMNAVVGNMRRTNQGLLRPPGSQ